MQPLNKKWVLFYTLPEVSLIHFVKQFVILLTTCCIYKINTKKCIKYLPKNKQVFVTKELFTKYWSVRSFRKLF